jgi:hypothetical protein
LRNPFAVFENADWKKPYLVYKNKMRGEAGASFYLVSEKFLKRVPELLKDHEFTMVDGWLSVLCRDGQLECFSHTQKDWFYGLTSEHLKGHHPPDVEEVPTSELLFDMGGFKAADANAPRKKVPRNARRASSIDAELV